MGFADTGIWVAIGNGDGTFQPSMLVLDGFNAAQGWLASKHVRVLGDLNGDRRSDIVGFGDAEVWPRSAAAAHSLRRPSFWRVSATTLAGTSRSITALPWT